MLVLSWSPRYVRRGTVMWTVGDRAFFERKEQIPDTIKSFNDTWILSLNFFIYAYYSCSACFFFGNNEGRTDA